MILKLLGKEGVPSQGESEEVFNALISYEGLEIVFLEKADFALPRLEKGEEFTFGADNIIATIDSLGHSSKINEDEDDIELKRIHHTNLARILVLKYLTDKHSIDAFGVLPLHLAIDNARIVFSKDSIFKKYDSYIKKIDAAKRASTIKPFEI